MAEEQQVTQIAVILQEAFNTRDVQKAAQALQMLDNYDVEVKLNLLPQQAAMGSQASNSRPPSNYSNTIPNYSFAQQATYSDPNSYSLNQPTNQWTGAQNQAGNWAQMGYANQGGQQYAGATAANPYVYDPNTQQYYNTMTGYYYPN